MSDASPQRRRLLSRRGFGVGGVLAAAATIVVLMLVSIFTLVTAAGGDYNQHAMVLYGTRASLYARAALLEAGLELGRKLRTFEGRNEVAGGSWEQLVSQVRTATGNDPSTPASGVVMERDLLALAPKAAEMAASGGAALTSVRLALRGFRRIATSPPGADLTDPSSYYFNEHLDPDGRPADPPAEDYTGFAVLEATVDFNGPEARVNLVRKLQCGQVLKISSTRPVAREFVFATWGHTGELADEVPLEQDLNHGGSLLLFGRRDGRVLLRGPYTLDSIGYPPPSCEDDPKAVSAGGEEPDPAFSTGFLPSDTIPPDLNTGGKYTWSGGWAAMPHPRGGVLQLCGPLFLKKPEKSQIRPNRWKILGGPSCPPPPGNIGEFLGALVGGLGEFLAGVAGFGLCVVDWFVPIDWLNSCWLLGADPGQRIEANQWWFNETQYPKRTEVQVGGEPIQATNYFSAMGATVPDSKDRVRISPFRGILGKDRPDNDTVFEAIEPFAHPRENQLGLRTPAELGRAENEQLSIVTEGLAALQFYRTTKCSSALCEIFYHLAVDRDGQGTNSCPHDSYPTHDQLQTYTFPYGLYWSRQEWASEYAALQADFFDFFLTVFTSIAAVKIGSAKLWKEILVGVAVGQLSSSVSQAVGQAWMNNNTGSLGVDDAAVSDDYRFPPGYRLAARTAIRRYHTLADYPGLITREKHPDLNGDEENDVLVLDGPIFIEDLRHDKPLLFVGRGSIITADKDRPYLTAPIVSGKLLADEFNTFTPDGGGEVLRASDYLGILGTETVRDYPDLAADDDSLSIVVAGDPDVPFSREAMLELRIADSFGTTFDYEAPAPVHAWIDSLNGVTPQETGDAVRIVGNLTCYYPNKRKTPEGSKLEVMYQPALSSLPGDLPSLSPVWSYSGGESP